MLKFFFWYVYVGVFGFILGLLYSVYWFDSYVGFLLIIFMFVVVISGFIGCYLFFLIFFSLCDKKVLRNDFYLKF